MLMTCCWLCTLLQELESSRKDGEPLSFEIGAGEITGNPLYQVRWTAGLQASVCVTRWQMSETRGNEPMKHDNMPVCGGGGGEGSTG